MRKIIFVAILFAGTLISQGCDRSLSNDPGELNDYIRKSAEQESQGYKLQKQQEEMRAQTAKADALYRRRIFSSKINNMFASLIPPLLFLGLFTFLGLSTKMSLERRIIYPFVGFAAYIILMMVTPTAYGPGAAYGKAYTVGFAVMGFGVFLVLMIARGIWALFKKKESGHKDPNCK